MRRSQQHGHCRRQPGSTGGCPTCHESPSCSCNSSCNSSSRGFSTSTSYTCGGATSGGHPTPCGACNQWLCSCNLEEKILQTWIDCWAIDMGQHVSDISLLVTRWSPHSWDNLKFSTVWPMLFFVGDYRQMLLANGCALNFWGGGWARETERQNVFHQAGALVFDMAMAMDQNLWMQFSRGCTSMCQPFWC